MEDTTIAKMYKNEHMTRIMSDPQYNAKYAMAMQLQEADECTGYSLFLVTFFDKMHVHFCQVEWYVGIQK